MRLRHGILVLAALAGVVALAVIVAGCGADQAPQPGSAEKPLVATHPPDTDEGGAQPSAKPGYRQIVERQRSHPVERFTPCNLVTKAQARAILGAPVKEPLEAPQGPTCIYRTVKGDGFITLAVQPLALSRIKSQLRNPRAVDASGRTGYCAVNGQPMLYVPLSRARLLSVAGPCSVARRFAARAVRQFSG